MSQPQPLFLWGAATSSHQIEGHNTKNDWWDWEARGFVEGGARSGAATDHWNRFREDLKIAADLGLTSYRFSVEWSRIEPEDGVWDETALDWYRALISECEKLNLLPMMTLHHFTSPLWFAKKGGFAWPEAPGRFLRFTKKVARTLGPHIPLWCTFNEPMVLVVGTYLGKFMPPAIFAPELASSACHNILKSHALSYNALHSEIGERKGPWRNLPLAVGIAHNMMDFRPERKWHPLEITIAKIFHRFYNRSWLDAVTGRKQHFGIAGLMPYAAQVIEARGRPTVDFIGVNYYTKAYIEWWPREGGVTEKPSNLPIGLSFARRHDLVSDVGWAIHPKGLGRMLCLAARYGLPLYITENGIADRADKMRPRYIVSHLERVAQARERGIDIRGYYYWSLLDNFEWVKGFGPRFGLYQVDYENFKRTPTQSAELIKALISAHGENPPDRATMKKIGEYFGIA